MGDEQAGDAQLAVQFFDFQPRLRAQLGIQVRQRLVKQKHLGLAHDGAAHGHALALPARELARRALQQVPQLQNGGGLVHAGANFLFGHLGNFQAVSHVFKNAHVRIQRVILKNHRNIPLRRLQLIDDAPAN